MTLPVCSLCPELASVFRTPDWPLCPTHAFEERSVVKHARRTRKKKAAPASPVPDELRHKIPAGALTGIQYRTFGGTAHLR
jgi:hypothetical protein